MSSPAHRRASSQAQSNGTPQPVRQNVASSSPLFFGSSQNGTPRVSANAARNGASNHDSMELSSPLKQASMAGSTPRGRVPGGKQNMSGASLALTGRKKSLPQSTMPRAQAPQEPQLKTHLIPMIFPAVVAAYLCARPGRSWQEYQDRTIQGVETFIPTSSVQRLVAAGASL